MLQKELTNISHVLTCSYINKYIRTENLKKIDFQGAKFEGNQILFGPMIYLNEG